MARPCALHGCSTRSANTGIMEAILFLLLLLLARAATGQIFTGHACGGEMLAAVVTACATFPDPADPAVCGTSCERAADALASEVTAGRCTNLPSSTERQLVALSATCASAGGPAAAAACATCAELGWPVTIRGLNYNRQVCATSAVLAVAGMTDATTPPVTPPANSPPAPCQSGVGYRAAEATCAALGARLCTIAEILNGDGSGTGCGHDNRLVWASGRSSEFAQCSSTEGMIVSGRNQTGNTKPTPVLLLKADCQLTPPSRSRPLSRRPDLHPADHVGQHSMCGPGDDVRTPSPSQPSLSSRSLTQFRRYRVIIMSTN